MLPTRQIITAVFGVSPHVRYVAICARNELSCEQRPDLSDASSSVSDQYEELLVNPTLLALATARGQIDCGGLEFILIRYGNFFQFVHPVRGGHISVAISPATDPLSLVEPIRELLRDHSLLPLMVGRRHDQ